MAENQTPTLQTMERVYEAEIKLLQEEIAMLQNQQENNEREVISHFGEHTQRALTSQPDFQRGTKDTAMNLKMELEKLEEDLARQTKMNGIVLNECEVNTLEKSKTKIVQQHRVSGNCIFLDFQVEFQLTEILEEEATIVRSITDLNIVVDGCEFIDISAFVSGVEETKSLLLFFRALRAFSERCEHRNRTFAHFKEKYPELVRLPEGCRGEVMVIQNPKIPGCTLSFVWNITVTKDGVIIPKIDLLTKLPEQAALALDQRMVAENGPQSFQSLLRILGVEATIEALIAAVCVE
ncbi:hypothetical protein SKAU_G00175760 [Synaphobranchus kaupii]|uniref:Centromere protein P n=1 Tax=Synaphobranchus kaupii TaxID=118154 RepID=A0A9Q1J095_SYNKA|nr:hypothetical protein SKAU_G00175760 [Synaphobranchus kaupii]